MTTILSIQSTVAFGHAGNSAAVFPLMRVGVEVWPVITVHFSNNTSYGGWRGPVLDASDVADVVRGIDERGVLGQVDAVLSGYQGDERTGAAILASLDLVRERNPEALYCCDPVMGDVGRGFYVHPGIPEYLRDHAVPRADIVTPNHFELDFLVGHPSHTLPELLAACAELRALGPKVVLVTSVVLDELPAGSVTMVAASADGAWLVTTPLLDRAFTGSGDVTAALFLANYLATSDPAQALGRTADSVFSLLAATAEADSRELRLVAAQDELVAPSHHFEVRVIR